MNKIILIFLVYYSHSFSQNPAGVFILIHGTWGIKSDWYRPEGTFFKAIEDSANALNCVVVPFMWSGRFDHTSRMTAGCALAKLIQSYPQNTSIHIIGHSHGGNVAIIASHILAADPKNKHSIDFLYTLGTPVNTKTYLPNMNIIKKLYNFFSFEDKVQPIFGLYSREFPMHPSIINIRIFIENKEPGHGQLTSKVVGHWIPLIHEELVQKKIGNLDQFNFNNPGIIYFYNDKPLNYTVETSRLLSIEKDKYETQLIAQTMAKKIEADNGQPLHF